MSICKARRAGRPWFELEPLPEDSVSNSVVARSFPKTQAMSMNFLVATGQVRIAEQARKSSCQHEGRQEAFSSLWYPAKPWHPREQA